jgi:hypothetical protein
VVRALCGVCRERKTGRPRIEAHNQVAHKWNVCGTSVVELKWPCLKYEGGDDDEKHSKSMFTEPLGKGRLGF